MSLVLFFSQEETRLSCSSSSSPSSRTALHAFPARNDSLFCAVERGLRQIHLLNWWYNSQETLAGLKKAETKIFLVQKRRKEWKLLFSSLKPNDFWIIHIMSNWNDSCQLPLKSIFWSRFKSSNFWDLKRLLGKWKIHLQTQHVTMKVSIWIWKTAMEDERC